MAALSPHVRGVVVGTSVRVAGLPSGVREAGGGDRRRTEILSPLVDLMGSSRDLSSKLWGFRRTKN